MQNLSPPKNHVTNVASKVSELAKRLSCGLLMTFLASCLLFMTGCSFMELSFGVQATIIVIAIFFVVVIGFLVFSFAREKNEMNKPRKPMTPEEEEEYNRFE